ncbi:MAG TPA: CinA family nicotinamide mononucleotide deamidase-related protein [Oligoflexia bacterium]|nr:CinA family nicotinamide mononucleotide deamidase-related protein [Oligoflexia bacterium]HMP49349.1 CinA family nicotinamide mononucleotide deamidase-related protein [Oligoflexia bacterium]
MSSLNYVSLILVGNELLSGEIADTNGRYLLEKIRSTNLRAKSIRVVADIPEQIKQAVRQELEESDFVITSGGLGPTSDDLTVASVADSLSLDLVEDSDSLRRLKEKYQSRGRPLNENSFKQTLFPDGARVLPNAVGTADACVVVTKINGKEKAIACLPGVPMEFRNFVDTSLWEWMTDFFKVEETFNSVFFRIFGLSESYVGSVIDSNKLIPEEVTIAYRPQFPELLLSLKSSKVTTAELHRIRQSIIDNLGPSFVVGLEESEKLPVCLSRLLLERNLKISFAESCTGGRLSSEITKIPGSSNYFCGSVVSYSNEMKTDYLEVPRELIERVGAVSEECALFMAEGISSRTGVDIALSITGIAGPGGGSENKETGLVYIGLVTENMQRVFKFNLPWDRERNQVYASWLALDVARRAILLLPMEWPVR